MLGSLHDSTAHGVRNDVHTIRGHAVYLLLSMRSRSARYCDLCRIRKARVTKRRAVDKQVAHVQRAVVHLVARREHTRCRRRCRNENSSCRTMTSQGWRTMSSLLRESAPSTYAMEQRVRSWCGGRKEIRRIVLHSCCSPTTAETKQPAVRLLKKRSEYRNCVLLPH